MREFEVKFVEGLKKGLREDDENSRNDEALVECLNTKPAEFGLIPIAPINYSITNPGGVTWPYPQLFEVSD